MKTLLKIWLYKYFLRFIPDSIYIRLQYRRKFGKWPDLKDPKTFNEKLQWLKLHDRNPLYTQLVDKYEVRKYIAEKIGEEYLIPLLGVWDKFDDIDFDKLPNQFVLKCTHDSGGLVICRDKSKLNIDVARKKINHCLTMNYYWVLREWPYKNVKPRIIAEKFLEESDGSDLKDYKFHSFHGVPKILLRVSDRFSEGKFDYFYADSFELANFCAKNGYAVNSLAEKNKPENYDKMLLLASTLACEFKYVRVDFYDVEGKIYFGELTFCDGGGVDKFNPEEWDYKFGEFLNL